jgi:hypothetical protein
MDVKSAIQFSYLTIVLCFWLNVAFHCVGGVSVITMVYSLCIAAYTIRRYRHQEFDMVWNFVVDIYFIGLTLITVSMDFALWLS